MPMQDSGSSKLARVAFQVQNSDGSENSRFDFALNPQSITEQTLNRSAYFNTADWGSVQNFGMGQKTINLSGTTGWRRGQGAKDAWALKSFLETYQENFPNWDANTLKKLYFYNYTDDYGYHVELAPNGYQFSQDVSQPILVRYTIELICIKDAGNASSQDKTSTVIGNPGAGGVDNGNVKPMATTAMAVAALRGDAK